METNLTEVYLDNSATTRCSERAKDLMVKVLMEDYGNPSSLHMKGVEAENYIKEAKKKITKTLKVDEKEILFTSGGTEHPRALLRFFWPPKMANASEAETEDRTASHGPKNRLLNRASCRACSAADMRGLSGLPCRA